MGVRQMEWNEETENTAQLAVSVSQGRQHFVWHRNKRVL